MPSVRRSVAVLAVTLAIAPSCPAQAEQISKGSRDDLRGATSIFVDTGVDPDLGPMVVEALRRELPELAIVDRLDDAALVLRFSTSIAPNREVLPSVSAADASIDAPDGADPGALPSPGAPASDRARRTTPGTARQRLPDPGAIDSTAPPPASDTYQFAIGSILRPTGPRRFTEAVAFNRRIGSDVDSAVRDFVRKFARKYRKVNPQATPRTDATGNG